jgi:hypothetical protein
MDEPALHERCALPATGVSRKTSAERAEWYIIHGQDQRGPARTTAVGVQHFGAKFTRSKRFLG